MYIHNYTATFLDEFYLDSNEVLRRNKDGYKGRFKKDDEVIPFKDKQGYLVVQIPKARAKIKTAHIRVLLLGWKLPKNFQVDHIDGNVTNEHSSNLRIVDNRDNSCNRRKRTDNTSGVTGIRWETSKQRYVIRRTVNGKRLSTSRKTMADALIALDNMTQQDNSYTKRHGK